MNRAETTKFLGELLKRDRFRGVGRCKCGAEFLDKGTNFCGNCGQKLDWNGRANDEADWCG